MTGAAIAFLGSYSPVTVASNWGSNVGSSVAMSATKTLTVPAGTASIVITKAGADTGQYSKNGGGFVTVPSGSPATVSVTNGDTLQFSAAGTGGSSCTITPTDSRTGDGIGGTWTGTTL